MLLARLRSDLKATDMIPIPPSLPHYATRAQEQDVIRFSAHANRLAGAEPKQERQAELDGSTHQRNASNTNRPPVRSLYRSMTRKGRTRCSRAIPDAESPAATCQHHGCSFRFEATTLASLRNDQPVGVLKLCPRLTKRRIRDHGWDPMVWPTGPMG
jgi:hypothetical protein